MTTTVLVTGGAGYIGSHAVHALLDAGLQPVVLDNLSTGRRALVPDGVPFYEGPVQDAALVEWIIRELKVDGIMHFAGSIQVGESVENPLKYYENNTGASRTLLETAIRLGVKAFIFSSTAATYGNPQELPVSEESPREPINPYGWSKLMTEQMIRDAAHAHPFKYGILRYFNVAGADPQGRTGQATPQATHLIKVAAEVVTGKRTHIDVLGTDYETRDGTGVRDYIHVADLAEAHVLLLKDLLAGGDSITMNCGYGRGFSVLEVLDAVERISGKSTNRRFAPRRAGDAGELYCDNSRIRARLDWHPKYADLDTIVATALSWEAKLQTSNSLA